MDMSYRILWIDDHPEHLQGARDVLSVFLSTLGLSLDEETISEFDERSDRTIAQKIRENNIHDLIVIDYDLGLGGIVNGVSLIKRIRTFSFATIVLYSAKSEVELRKLVFENAIDGVFIIEKTQLKTKILPIVDHSVSRVLHPSYIRGLVVGTVGEIEGIFNDMLEQLISKGGDTCKGEFIGKYVGSTKTFHEDELRKLDVVSNENYARYIKRMNLRQKIGILAELMDQVASTPAEFIFVEKLQHFLDDINAPRIALAHCPLSKVDGRVVIVDKGGKEWGSDALKQLLITVKDFKTTCMGVLNK
ncbi:TPA: hypothetical protein ACSPZI_003790 [Aeromonas hydrophila]